MAKRFTDTNKWDDPWFLELPLIFKLAWIYLVDKCSNAGIWKVNKKLADFVLGQAVNWEDFVTACGDRISILGDGQKWFIKKFIDFQYGTLQRDCRPHLAVINELEKERVSLPFGYPIQRVEDKDKDKDKDKEKDKDKDKDRGVQGGKISDEDFWESLRTNPAYKHIDLESEKGKMSAWLQLPKNKGRKMSRQFVLSWLNKIEVPLNFQSGPDLSRYKKALIADNPSIPEWDERK